MSFTLIELHISLENNVQEYKKHFVSKSESRLFYMKIVFEILYRVILFHTKLDCV